MYFISVKWPGFPKVFTFFKLRDLHLFKVVVPEMKRKTIDIQ